HRWRCGRETEDHPPCFGRFRAGGLGSAVDAAHDLRGRAPDSRHSLLIGRATRDNACVGRGSAGFSPHEGAAMVQDPPFPGRERSVAKAGDPLASADAELAPSRPASPLSASETLIGSSESFLRVIRKIPRLAASDATVLIAGETGTGKELVANAIHA